MMEEVSGNIHSHIKFIRSKQWAEFVYKVLQKLLNKEKYGTILVKWTLMNFCY